MQLADAWLVIPNSNGSNVPLRSITPAEAVFLNHERKQHKDDNESKIIHVKLVGDVKRSDADEKARLMRQYGKRDPKTEEILVEKLFPGATPRMPQTFEDVGIKVDGTEPPKGKLFGYPLIQDIPRGLTAEDLEGPEADIAELRRELASLKGQVGGKK
jgi:hypothetical protein